MEPLPPPPPPNHAFLLTQVSSYANVPLNLATQEGQGIHRRLTESFADEFDGDAKNVLTFVSNLRERVTAAGWDLTTISMLNIPVLIMGMPRT